MDPRIEKLAQGLIKFSLNVKKGDCVLIDAQDAPESIIIALINTIRKQSAKPFLNLKNTSLLRTLLKEASQEEMKLWNEFELSRIKKMDAYIAIRGSYNIFELSDVPNEQISQMMKTLKPSMDWRVNKTRWVILRWPTPSMAQQSFMSTEAFEDFFYKVCTLDYARMKPGMQALKDRMEKTHMVRIIGPETKLTFSIKNIPAICCGGEFNIPDGEVFTAPIKDSVEGYITYNAPSVYQGYSFENVRFEFKKGKIINASANNTEKLNTVLDSDKGARFIGEFAIGFNPHIKEPMRDILFDEKIAGSFHLTPGQAYETADNGNRSQVHWDLVSIQRPEYGGGEIYFDEELIRKDGLFTPKYLQKLNPDYLIGNSNE